MARLNAAAIVPKVFTHEGAPAYQHMTPEQELRRSVLSCLLWESEFYEDGEEIAVRIAKIAGHVPVGVLASLADEARNKFHLRHVPLLLLAALAGRAQGTSLVSDTIERSIARADELSEFLAVYAKVNGVTPDKLKGKLSAQVKKGLARAFTKFTPHQLAKYNRDSAIKLRDVLFLVHPRPNDPEQQAVWDRLAKGELESPDTWEVALSGGADKRETFERLLTEGKLGYLALLRNLRNMAQSGVNPDLIKGAILARKGGAEKVFPFRFIAAARAAPQFEPVLDMSLSEAISAMPIMRGKTVVLVDVSGSMDAALSAKSDMTRADAAAALASIVHGDLRVFTFSDQMVEVPPRRGMAGVDAILKSQEHSGTQLGAAVETVNRAIPHDRLIVVTDEQAASRVPDPVARNAYMINVASARNGVGYGKWNHIDGFSEQVIRFINERENAQ